MKTIEQRFKALEAEANARGLTVYLAVITPMQPGQGRRVQQYGEHHAGDLGRLIDDALNLLQEDLRYRDLCSCSAQLQPHDRLPDVCPEPKR